jgi:hypothetical protein
MNRMVQSSYFLDYVQSRMVIAAPEDTLLEDELTTKQLSAVLTTAQGPSAPAAAEDDVATLEDVQTEVVVEAETKAKAVKKHTKKRSHVSAEGGSVGDEAVAEVAIVEVAAEEAVNEGRSAKKAHKKPKKKSKTE